MSAGFFNNLTWSLLLVLSYEAETSSVGVTPSPVMAPFCCE
jgi:hypothetical protein